MILSRMVQSIGQGISTDSAVTASTVLMALITAAQPMYLFPSLMPVDFISGIATKYCQGAGSILPISSLTMASASRTASNLSRVIAPTHLTSRPGPVDKIDSNQEKYSIKVGCFEDEMKTSFSGSLFKKQADTQSRLHGSIEKRRWSRSHRAWHVSKKTKHVAHSFFKETDFV